ncbi:hypothetical protein Cfor_05518 [Coptotermes formosanus]|uniref:Uncharacterized protein n=1 Tax=Coptotermes formosanus TaxID=36987 RepID=A0A6L2PKY1_COPFO|nr:hypothetical protein Cfor_05518 [Coptotermes formosanus]
MGYGQLVYVFGILAAFPCMGYPAPGQPAGGVTWTLFASPPFQQQFHYSTPVRVFSSSFDYPERSYEMWGVANIPPLWDAAPTNRTPRIKRSTPQHEASTGNHKRSKRFLPYFYGGMPGMMMGGYGASMASASASAMATDSYGSYGYPFFG